MGDLSFYQTKKKKIILIQGFQKKDVYKSHKVNAKEGVGVFFLSGPNSYHSVSKFYGKVKKRYFIYGSYSLNKAVTWFKKIKIRSNLMQNLNKFRLNLEKINSLENIIILKNYIENFFAGRTENFYFRSSLHLDLDEKILSLKCRTLAQKFVFENNKFEDNFSFIKLIYQFFIFLDY